MYAQSSGHSDWVPDDDNFADQIEVLRPALFGYVLSLLPSRDVAEDVVQETCLFLWEKRADFETGTNFKAWAFKTAWFKALSHRREMQRNKLVNFSEDVLQRIAGAAEEQAEWAETRLAALQFCIARLTDEEARLVKLKYVQRASLTEHARQLGWKPSRLQKSLSRIRLALRHCIDSRLSDQS